MSEDLRSLNAFDLRRSKEWGDIAKKTMDEQGANNWLLVLTNIGTTHKTHTFTADFPRLSETRIPFWFMFQTFFFLFQGRKASQLIQPKHQVFFFSPLSSLFFFLFHVLCFRKRKKRLEKMSILFTWDFLFDKDKCCGEQRGTYPFFFLSLSFDPVVRISFEISTYISTSEVGEK